MNVFWADLKYTIRLLSRTPLLSGIIILSLALSLGANSVMFNLADAVLFRPLPYGNPGKLVSLIQSDDRSDHDWISPADYLDWKSQNHVFDDLAACMAGGGGEVDTGTTVTSAMGFKASSNFFDVLQVKAALGRTFLPEDSMPGAGQVVVLSYPLWQQAFNGDPKVIGRTLLLNHNAFIVVGVMPKNFWFLLRQVELWTPIRLSTPEMMLDRSRSSFYVLGRVKERLRLRVAQTEMDGIEQRLAQAYPLTNAKRRISVKDMHGVFVQDGRTILLVLAAAVAMLLIVACANTANLLLARAGARLKEKAVRSALGARPWQLIRQPLFESVLLALVSGLLGMLLAYWGNRLVLRLLPPDFSWWLPTLDVRAFGINGSIVAFTFALSLLTGIIAGLAPILSLLRIDFIELLKRKGAFQGGDDRGFGRTTLIISELTLTLVLLVGAGLMLKNFVRLQNVDPGYRKAGLLTVRFTPPRFYDEGHRIVAYKQVIDNLKPLPGVESVALINGLFSPSGYLDAPVSVEGEFASPDRPVVLSRYVSQGYFHAVDIPFHSGRDFAESDTTSSLPVAIVSRQMAQKLWPGKDPLGKRVQLHELDQEPWVSVIGVVGEANYYEAWSGRPAPTIYLPLSQHGEFGATILLHTNSKSLEQGKEITDALRKIDKGLRIPDPATIEQIIADATWQPRFGMLILMFFAGIAVLLATMGVYGLMSYSVMQQTYEIGLRMALGADRLQVLKMVLKQALRVIAVGLALGLAISFAVSSALAGQLSQVVPHDPAIMISVSLLLCLMGVLASYVPARRAMSVDPQTALREE